MFATKMCILTICVLLLLTIIETRDLSGGKRLKSFNQKDKKVTRTMADSGRIVFPDEKKRLPAKIPTPASFDNRFGIGVGGPHFCGSGQKQIGHLCV